MINKKLSDNGLLLIWDFDSLFKHSNKDFNTKNLISFKMSYDSFLVESGLFEILYKFKYKMPTKDKRKFKSDTASLTLFKKIDFRKNILRMFKSCVLLRIEKLLIIILNVK